TTLALTLRALRSFGGALLASEGQATWAVRAREAHEAALRDALVRAAAAATALHDHELANDLLARVQTTDGPGATLRDPHAPSTDHRSRWRRAALPVAHG
ncbi:MAG: hypothetical protein IE926_06285, partial [Micrococcales bacterium]|nr:hypothetical protein [Micrococcales bacterium]